MAAVSGVRLNQQDPELPLAPDGGWGWVVCAGRDGHNTDSQLKVLINERRGWLNLVSFDYFALSCSL
jgi:hypothetical protein